MLSIQFSIIITCYDQESLIEDAIESALMQPCKAKEVIAVDDGSRDNSLRILKRYEPAITVIHLATNAGAAEARNRGAAAAAGTYLLFLDGDDLLTPDALEIYQRLISERRPAAIVSGARRFEGSVPMLRGEPRKRIEFFEYSCLMAKDRSHGLNIGAFVIDRAAFNTVDGWSRELFHLDGQDLYTRLAYSGKAIVVHTPYTMFYRMHAANSIHSVAAYVKAAHVVMKRERAGIYPGGRSKLFERYARHGGIILFCVKRVLRAGLYPDAVRLVGSGWLMIVAAIIRRMMACAKGRQRLQVLELSVLDEQPRAAVITAHNNRGV